MKLKKLKLENFRCFESLEISFENQLTVIVAENGGGKSTILDAIATGFGPFLTRLPKVSGKNPKESDMSVDVKGRKATHLRITLESTDGISWDRTERRDQSTARKVTAGIGTKQLFDFADSFVDAFNDGKEFQFPIIAYYGTGRGVFDFPQRRRGVKKDFLRFEALDGALDANSNFKRFFEYFYFLEELERREQSEQRDFDLEQPELKAIRNAIQRAMPEFSQPHSKIRPLRFLINWTRDDVTRILHIGQLSDGYRTTLALIMDIAARMAEANPDMEDPLATEGIVLIDEVDMHLHPKWQQLILMQLQKTFPNIQFIVTTHSPQVLSTVPKECIRVLGINTVGNAVAAIPKAFSYGEPSNDILQAIMHVDPQPPVPEKQELDLLTSLVDQGDYKSEQAQQLLAKLKQQLNENHPQIAKIERSIRRQEAFNG